MKQAMTTWENASDVSQTLVLRGDGNEAHTFVIAPGKSHDIPSVWDYAVPKLAPLLIKAQPKAVAPVEHVAHAGKK